MHPVNSGVMLGPRGCDAGKLSRHPTNYEDTKLKDGGIHIMISRLIVAVAVALFFTPAALVCAQEHPEHPKKEKTSEHPKKGAEHPKKGAEHPEKAGAEKEVSTADISAGIKKNIDTQSKKSGDGKFHVKYEGQDLALDLIKV